MVNGKLLVAYRSIHLLVKYEHLSFIGNCTEGWLKIKDKCYKYFSNSKPWAAARESCKGFGGNLATVTSAKQELKITSLVGSSYYSGIWIG